MRTLEQLQQLHAASLPAPRERGRIDLLVVRSAPGRHETPATAEVTPAEGMVGDRWAKPWGWQRDVERQLR